MKIKAKINLTKKVTHNELPEAWSKEDYIKILDELGFSDPVEASELRDMTLMALADQEPEESATLLLKYRLGEELNDGQIQSLSHEMQTDKVAEEYPEINLHHELYNVNQLLFTAFNGRFPNCKVVECHFTMKPQSAEMLENEEVFKQYIIKALAPAMGDHSVIQRLYEDELTGKKEFSAADNILWKVDYRKEADGTYAVQIFSSEYWLHDLPSHGEYDVAFEQPEEVEHDD